VGWASGENGRTTESRESRESRYPESGGERRSERLRLRWKRD